MDIIKRKSTNNVIKGVIFFIRVRLVCVSLLDMVVLVPVSKSRDRDSFSFVSVALLADVAIDVRHNSHYYTMHN